VIVSDHDDDLAAYSSRRTRRVRFVAWVTIAALILSGGFASVLALLVR